MRRLTFFAPEDFAAHGDRRQHTALSVIRSAVSASMGELARGWPAARRNEVIDIALGLRALAGGELLRGFRGGPYVCSIS